jgi:GTPase-associated protein 1, N-terminal domain type 2
MSTKWNASLSDQQSQTAALEQLWYTWSTVGLGPLSAGFRIRAASSGLSDIHSARVQDLDQYLRYTLPAGTDRFAITPDMAPLCLSVIQTDWGERILVNKTYIGKDGVGRPGAFFIHLLGNLPSNFSASDAIALWRSSFWQSSDTSIGTSLQLKSVPLEELEKARKEIDVMHPRGIDSMWVKECFPLVIRAYLMWRKRWEQWQREKPQQQPQMSQGQNRQMQENPPRIYIAAPADMVAVFIMGISRCLPQQLLMGLTFSTYEDDVSSSGQVLLVGTSWPPSLDEKLNKQQDLPAVCYQEGVAINCYSDDHTQTRLENNHLAIDFAADATRYLSGQSTRSFEALLRKSSLDRNLSVDRFLQNYDTIVKAPPPTKENVLSFLRMPDIADERLSEEIVQEFIYDHAIRDRAWRAAILPALNNLFAQSRKIPTLAVALDQFVQGAQDRATAAADDNDRLSFEAMKDLMANAAPAMSKPDVWVKFLNALQQKRNAWTFFSIHHDIYYTLLEIWATTLRPEAIDMIRPFLKVFWNESETFFSLRLPIRSQMQSYYILARSFVLSLILSYRMRQPSRHGL